MTSHKMTDSREYRIWRKLKQAFINPNDPAYKSNKIKGISICQEWLDDFRLFLRDMKNVPEDCNAINLLTNKKVYCKENCYWIFRARGKRKDYDHKNAIPKKTPRSQLRMSKNLCLTLDKHQFEFIERQASQKSLSEGKHIHPNDLIRQALNKVFPYTSALDICEEEK